MENKIIKPIKKLSGEMVMPGDKSISHRAIMIGAIAKGETVIKGLLDCDDCNYTIRAFKEMGVKIKKDKDATVISGASLKGLAAPDHPLHVGNSGTTMRILAGILAGQDFTSTLQGDKSLSNRPMERITEPLALMGADIKTSEGGLPPLIIKGGKLKPISYDLPIPSAQIKSAILFAGLYADGTTTLREAIKSRDHTERMLKIFGAKLKVEGLKVSVEGGEELAAKHISIPGDISSASFFMAGATLIKGSKIRIKDLSINPTRAGIIDILLRMGANITVVNKKDSFEPTGDIVVESAPTKGIVIEADEIPRVIDELPIIFVLASLSKGRTVIKGAGELRVKETDRIASMEENIRHMGGELRVEADEVLIDGVGQLKGADLKSFGDHRTCMAMAIAALTAEGESAIDDVECVNKSFPEFFGMLKKYGS